MNVVTSASDLMHNAEHSSLAMAELVASAQAAGDAELVAEVMTEIRNIPMGESQVAVS